MAFPLFWIKIFFKRFLGLLKASPVVTAEGMLFAGALVYTGTNIQIALKSGHAVFITALLFITAFAASMSGYAVLNQLTFYAKSNCSNSLLRRFMYLKKALKNNIPLCLFWLLCLTKRIVISFPVNAVVIMSGLILSTVVSFAVISRERPVSHPGFAARRNDRKPQFLRAPRTAGSMCAFVVQFKIIFLEYKPVFAGAVFVTAASIFIGIEFLKDPDALRNMSDPRFIPLAVLCLLQAGLYTLNDVTENINWTFYAVNSVSFNRVINKTLRLLLCSYGTAAAICLVFTAWIDPALLFMYGFSIISITLFCTGVSFYSAHPIKKAAVMVLTATAVFNVLLKNPYAMLLSVFPAGFVLLRAKSEFAGRMYL